MSMVVGRGHNAPSLGTPCNDRASTRRFLPARARIVGGAALAALMFLGVRQSLAGVKDGGPSEAGLSMREGELVAYVADVGDGNVRRSYALRSSDGREIPVEIQQTPGLVTGARVRLTGTMVAGILRPSRVELLADGNDVAVAARPTVGTYAFVLVDLGSGVDITPAQARAAMFGTGPSDKSLASFYYESSYGKYEVAGDVLGPYPYSMNTCDVVGMAQAIEGQVTKTYDHFIYFFSRTPSCEFGGLAEEGSVTKPSKRTWLNGSLSCAVLMQEPAHNLGLMHANTMTCSDAPLSATPATSCTIDEYGSGWTVMGSGCHQFNGYEKWYERWLSGCNGLRVTSSGTFHLAPLGRTCPQSVQVLQVPMPVTRVVSDPQSPGAVVDLKDYYVEFRAPAGIFDQYSTGARTGSFTEPAVTVYVSDDVHSGSATAVDGGGGNSVWTELLDMNPDGGVGGNGGLQVGVPFSDPSGSPIIMVRSLSSSEAVVEVSVPGGTGDPTCIDGTTWTGEEAVCDAGASMLVPEDASVVGDGAREAGAISGCGCEWAGAAGTGSGFALLAVGGCIALARRSRRPRRRARQAPGSQRGPPKNGPRQPVELMS